MNDMPTNKKQTFIKEETTVPSQDPNVQLAVANNDIRHINESILRLETKFDEAIKAFVTNEQLVSHQLRADDKHKEQDGRIRDLERNQVWIVRTIVGAVVAAVLALVFIP